MHREIREARNAGFVASLCAAVIIGAFASAQPAAASGDKRTGMSHAGNYLAGRFATARNDTLKAAQFYTRALKGDPDNPYLLERAFLLELGAGNVDEAEQLAWRLVRHDRNNRMARLVLGARQIKAGNPAAARAHFEKASHARIGELSSGLMSAWTHAAEGNYRAAVKVLDDLRKTDSFGIYLAFHSAMILDLAGEYERAGALYKQAFDEASTSVRLAQAYGNFLERMGRTAEAQEVYGTFLGSSLAHPLIVAAMEESKRDKMPARFVASSRAGAAEALFGIASALAEDAGMEVAVPYARLALFLEPRFPIAQVLLADIYSDAGRHDVAIEIYRKIPRSSALYEHAELQIAANLDRLERTDEAIDRLKKLAAARPDSREPLMTLGNILRGRSQFAEAAEVYSKAIDLIDEPKERDWTLYYFRGIAYERSKQWPKAEADFKQAIALHPDQPLVLNYLGYSWLEQKQNLQEAMRMIRKAVELRPNDGYIVDSLGWAHYQLGDYDSAVKELERAVELRPEDPVINDHLGDAYWRVGRRLEAKFQWQHAHDLKPEPEQLEIIKKKLEAGLPDEGSKAAKAAAQPDNG